jgi:hypothetical protein
MDAAERAHIIVVGMDHRPEEIPLDVWLVDRISHAIRVAEKETGQWWESHTEMLDRNWEAHHNSCLNAIRGALEIPNATIPEMVATIYKLKEGSKQPA